MFLRIFVLLLLVSNVFAQTGTLKIVSNASGTLKIDGEDKGSMDAGISQNKITPVNNSNPLNIEMVFVEGGTFIMGCKDDQGDDCFNVEKPAHYVTLSSYYIGKYEVTQEQWREVMGTNPSYFKNCDHCPVESVSWKDIQQFIQNINQKTGKRYRLPTEAEWEYAARGGNMSRGYKFAGSDNIDSITFYGNGVGKTFPIGQKQANELGIHDMSGNVWECCSDWFGDYKIINQNNPQGPTSGSFRVMRGGGWSLASQYSRVYFRGINGFGYAEGFRLVLDN